MAGFSHHKGALKQKREDRREWNKQKIPAMLDYYARQHLKTMSLAEFTELIDYLVAVYVDINVMENFDVRTAVAEFVFKSKEGKDQL